MKPEGHLEKAKAFEDRASRWESEHDAPSVIKDIFDAFVHYVAYGINMKFGTDIDGHAPQKRFLRSVKFCLFYAHMKRSNASGSVRFMAVSGMEKEYGKLWDYSRWC